MFGILPPLFLPLHVISSFHRRFASYRMEDLRDVTDAHVTQYHRMPVNTRVSGRRHSDFHGVARQVYRQWLARCRHVVGGESEQYITSVVTEEVNSAVAATRDFRRFECRESPLRRRAHTTARREVE